MRHTIDTIDVLPNITGQHGRAWRVDLDAYRLSKGLENGGDAALICWIVEAPWAHPFWHSYVFDLIHLRPLSDNRDTLYYVENATHEMHLFALDPDAPRAPVVVGQARPSILLPINFAAQMANHTDAEALHRIEDTVRLICDGKLSPDTDYRQSWGDLFGSNMIKKEYRESVH